jgi:hypothetical protein
VRARLVECLGEEPGVLSAWSSGAPPDRAPSVTEDLAGFGEETATTTVDERPRGAALQSRRRWPLVLVLLLGVAVATAVILGRTRSGDEAEGQDRRAEALPAGAFDAGASPSSVVPDAALASAPALADAGAEAVAPSSATVELDLRSTPRAGVEVDGKRVGRTPIKVRVPRAEKEIEILFRRRGSRLVRKTVVPDRDHAIDVSLRKKPRTTKPSKPKYPF